MKKSLLIFFLICAASVIFVGCKPELKSIRGEVKSISVSNDTLKAMVITADGQDFQVDMTRSRIQQGVALQGDSVIVDYIDGDNGTLISLVCTSLPKAAQYFEPSDSLITRESAEPADSVQ